MDVDAIVARVDVEPIIERVDVNAVIGRVDIEQVVDRLDIDALVEQTELGTIIARSTTGVASEVLDVVRAQGVGLDDFMARWVNRILLRNGPGLGPPAGAEAPALPAVFPLRGRDDRRPVPGRHRRAIRPATQGHYAGAVTRLVAFALDVGVSWGHLHPGGRRDHPSPSAW